MLGRVSKAEQACVVGLDLTPVYMWKLRGHILNVYIQSALACRLHHPEEMYNVASDCTQELSGILRIFSCTSLVATVDGR